MTAKITNGATFIGAEFYDQGIYSDGKKIVRTLACEGVIMYYGRGGSLEPDPTTVARCFELQAALNPRVEKPVKHIALSWPQEDMARLSDRELVEVAKEYLEGMGFIDTQYLITRHMETDNPHIHIIVNKVNNKGKRLKDFRERRRNIEVCKKITLERQYTWGRHKTYSTCDIPPVSQARCRETVRYEMAQSIAFALSEIDCIEKLQERLLSNGTGISVSYRNDSNGNPIGVIFSKEYIHSSGRREVYRFSGGKIDSRLTLKNMQRILKLKDKFPELRSAAREMIETYDQNKEYPFSEEVRNKCEELRMRLSMLRREENRINREMAEASPRQRLFLIVLIFINPIAELWAFLFFALANNIRRKDLQYIESRRQEVKQDFFAIKNAFTERYPKEWELKIDSCPKKQEPPVYKCLEERILKIDSYPEGQKSLVDKYLEEKELIIDEFPEEQESLGISL